MNPARVIGTAGHIDHGKTALVRALTGIDTDRLKEEKARGITIELGFAHLDLPTGERVGVVDVPGHERFVRTMVAGAVGVDLVVLVVAADEGVMPQTREHLDICELLGIERGVVALSKVDLVDDELAELAKNDVAEALAGSFLEQAPIVACSAKSGAGLDALKAAIAAGLGETRGKDADALLRLPIDRVFSMKGFGTVVTGTLWAGRLRVGDEVVAVPASRSAASSPVVGKVRGLQVHGAAVDEARAGSRTAVNLTTAKEALARGQVLARPDELEATRIVDVRLHQLASAAKALPRRARVLVHAGTAQSLATVALLDAPALEPGQSGLAQLALDEPLLVLPGDRFIVRGFQRSSHHGTTIAGGVVVATLGPRLRRGSDEIARFEQAFKNPEPDERVRLEIARAGESGISRRALQMRLPYSPRVTEAALLRLQQRRSVIRYDKESGALIAKESLAALGRAALTAVEAFHAAQPVAVGMPRGELTAKVTSDLRLLHLVLETLAGERALVIERDSVRRPTHDPKRQEAQAELAPLAERALALYHAAALAPPRPAEAAATLAVAVAALQPALELLVKRGDLVRVSDLLFARRALDELRERLRAHLVAHATIAPPEWKEMVGASRKFAIPLAEHFDAEKLTLRVGDLRKLRAR